MKMRSLTTRASGPGRSYDRTGSTSPARVRGREPGSINILIAHGADAMMSMNGDEYEEIEFGVDSGASDTVVGPNMLPGVETKESESSRRGVTYEIATGEMIPNLGEKKFIGVTNEEVARGMTAQVADVSTPLLSVRKMLQSGHRVVFDFAGSYIEDKETGEIMHLQDKGSMHYLKMWVKRRGF